MKKGKHKGRRRSTSRPKVEPAAPSPALVKALLDALGRPTADTDPETADSLLDAAGALALKEARPRLDALCRSPYPTTREHAAKALTLVFGEKKACDAPAESPPPAELDHLVTRPVTLALDTDAGALTLVLDPTVAPVTVTRVVDLARAGYYDGLVVHRVVPGFVAQFGAPFGDGFGGPEGKPAIRCETSPLPFVPLAVGVALAGRDTGSSQLFVMLGRYPHLDGLYALVGTAAGPWSGAGRGRRDPQGEGERRSAGAGTLQKRHAERRAPRPDAHRRHEPRLAPVGHLLRAHDEQRQAGAHRRDRERDAGDPRRLAARSIGSGDPATTAHRTGSRDRPAGSLPATTSAVPAMTPDRGEADQHHAQADHGRAAALHRRVGRRRRTSSGARRRANSPGGRGVGAGGRTCPVSRPAASRRLTRDPEARSARERDRRRAGRGRHRWKPSGREVIMAIFGPTSGGPSRVRRAAARHRTRPS